MSVKTHSMEQGLGFESGLDHVDILVVIVNWNAGDKLLACLESIPSSSSALTVRVVVFDNASTDGSCDLIKEDFPDVELIRHSENLGFARGNNSVIRKFGKSASHILLLNPDTVLSAEALAKMLEFMKSHPDVGIVGCKIVTPSGTLDWACKRSFLTPSLLFYKALRLDKLFPKSRQFGRYQLTYVDENQICEVDALVGAFMMVRRECVEDVGLLDETYFMYGEDLDYCYRAKDAGWRIFYVPTATILHHKGESTRKNSYGMIGLWYDSTWKLYQRRIAPRYSPIVNGLVWAGLHTMWGLSLGVNALRRQKRVPSRR